MTEAQIYATLNDIFRDLFDDDTLLIHAGTRAADVAGWDSFNHVNLLVAVEMKLGIKFTTAEVESLKTVGDLAARIEAKLRTKR